MYIDSRDCFTHDELLELINDLKFIADTTTSAAVWYLNDVDDYFQQYFRRRQMGMSGEELFETLSFGPLHRAATEKKLQEASGRRSVLGHRGFDAADAETSFDEIVAEDEQHQKELQNLKQEIQDSCRSEYISDVQQLKEEMKNLRKELNNITCVEASSADEDYVPVDGCDDNTDDETNDGSLSDSSSTDSDNIEVIHNPTWDDEDELDVTNLAHAIATGEATIEVEKSDVEEESEHEFDSDSGDSNEAHAGHSSSDDEESTKEECKQKNIPYFPADKNDSDRDHTPITPEEMLKSARGNTHSRVDPNVLHFVRNNLANFGVSEDDIEKLLHVQGFAERYADRFLYDNPDADITADADTNDAEPTINSPDVNSDGEYEI